MHNCNMHANIMSSQYGESMFDAEEKTYIYTDEPTKFDILCGRDKLSFNNAGNIRFRSVVILNLQKYKMSECKFERSRVVDGIKGELQKTGGRFLKFDRKARRWNKLSGREISDKISHALRDKHPPMISAKLKMGKAPLFKLRMTPVNSGTSTLIQKGAMNKLSSSTNRDYTSTSEDTTLPNATPLGDTDTTGLSTQKRGSSQVSNFRRRPKLLSVHHRIAPNFVVTARTQKNAPFIKPISSKGVFFPESLKGLWASVELDHVERDEFMDEINALDFSGVGDHYLEYLDL